MNKRGRTKKPPAKKTSRPAFERRVYKIYEINSIKRGFKFKLSMEEFTALIYLNCFYCGAKPYNKMTNTGSNGKKINFVLYYSGIDRKDNKKGYTPDNVVPCCKRCNRIKSDLFTFEEMLKLSKFLQGLPKDRGVEAPETEAQLVSILQRRIESLRKFSGRE